MGILFGSANETRPFRFTHTETQVALSVAGRVEYDFAVVERLAELVEDFPLEAVECLRLMVEGQTDPWGVLGFREEGKQVLRAALASSNPDAVTAAKRLVNQLCAMGYLQFRELLREPNSGDGEPD